MTEKKGQQAEKKALHEHSKYRTSIISHFPKYPMRKEEERRGRRKEERRGRKKKEEEGG